MKPKWLPGVLLALFVCAAAAQQPSPQIQQPAAADADQMRKSLANTARRACLIEYENPNFNAQLLSIGWEREIFCQCVEARTLVTLDDAVAKQTALWIIRTQNALKTPDDLALLSNQPQVAEYLKVIRNARGRCIQMKMHSRE